MADDDLAWETTDTRIDYTCPGFDIRMDDVRLPDGTETDFHYVDEPPAVVILPFTADGDVVVIDEWRQAVERTNRGLPAGGTEAGDDDYEAAAHRELTEETGYVAETMEPLVTVEPANGIANSVFHYFVARGCEKQEAQRLDFNESIRPTTVAYDELLQSVRDGDVRDGRTALGVLHYELTQG
ncbi:NUDIX hydrolase [Haloferax larsenii]|uniref:NUDIX hydrolase n=1 Tax=Haloferax larsenii TaxID=302484 RepID=A0ABY5REL6_HALLR|nr:NUDIX hydrolase [Haloferax larsenii]ELZ79578.1 ADP-ribose pyrophosphatase, Mut/nudix family protein [Haloferax larsenii JCM 13917]UVE50766.1 NUDIX hydrolase [Haloferax larsenii]